MAVWAGLSRGEIYLYSLLHKSRDYFVSRGCFLQSLEDGTVIQNQFSLALDSIRVVRLVCISVAR